MGIPIDEAEFEDVDEVTPDLLENVFVQTSSYEVDDWQLADIHVDQPTADGVHKEKQGCRKEIKLSMFFCTSCSSFQCNILG